MEIVVSNSKKKKAILVDLDGTLANCDHRRHHVETIPKNWEAFFAGIPDDKVNHWCMDLVYGYHANAYDIVFMTGRMELHRDVTMKWLHKNVGMLTDAGGRGFYRTELFMRANNDFRPDHETKLDLYKTHVQPHYDILFAVDDRASVVKMWRSIGLTCLQCADGDF